MNRVPDAAARVAAAVLRDLVRTQAGRAGAGEAQAALLADLLVGNDLRGVFSHGSRQIATYARHLRASRLNPRPQLRTLDESAATLLLDGDAGLGYFPAWEAAHHLVTKARAVVAQQKAVAQALVPLRYTSGARFDHDPAVPAPALQLLRDLPRLGQLDPEGDEARFLHTALVRRANAVAHSLRKAAQAARGPRR